MLCYGMKVKPFAILLLLSVIAQPASAQDSKIPRRGISGGGSFGPPRINVIPQEPVKGKTIVTNASYMTISPERQWKSTDGKSILASLLTFNADGKTAEELKTTKLEVIKDGKVRLLKGAKPFILPLDRLSAEDQKFVKGVAESAAKRDTGKAAEGTKKDASENANDKKNKDSE